jgi:hypothetical protein
MRRSAGEAEVAGKDVSVDRGGGREEEKREGAWEEGGRERRGKERARERVVAGREQGGREREGKERRVAQQSTRSVAPRAVSAPLPCLRRWTSARITASAASTRTCTRGQAKSTAGARERWKREKRGRRESAP